MVSRSLAQAGTGRAAVHRLVQCGLTGGKVAEGCERGEGRAGLGAKLG